MDDDPRQDGQAFRAPGPFAGDDPALLQLIVDESTDSIAIYDREARLRFASRSVSAHFGFDADALPGTHLLEIVHHQDAPLARAVLSGVMKGLSGLAELRLCRADAEPRWVEMTARPFFQDGVVNGLVVIFRNVPAARAAAYALERLPAAPDSRPVEKWAAQPLGGGGAPTGLPGGAGAAFAPGYSGDGYLELGLDGSVVALNRRYLELFGLSEAEIAEVQGTPNQAMRIAEVVQQKVADRGTYLRGIGRHLALLGEASFEDIPLRDGRWLERYAAPRRGPGGAVTGRALFLRDVTPQRRDEIELRERARQHEAVAELGELALNAGEPQALLNMTARMVASTLEVDLVRVVEVAPGGEHFILRASNLEGGGLPEETCSPISGSMAQFALANQAPVVSPDLSAEQRFEAPVLRQLGIVSSAVVVVRGRDRPFGVLGAHARRRRLFTRDDVHFLDAVANVLAGVLARHEAEVTLLDHERQLRAVFEHALDALVTFDDAGRVVEANPAACSLFGRPRAEILGRPMGTLFTPRTRELAEAARHELMRQGKLSGEAEAAPPGLPPRPIEFSALANILPGLHFVVMRDVTQQRAMQARLALADRMASVGTLAAGVAHELNNPLAYVTANLSWVAEGLAGGKEGKGESTPVRADILQAIEEARQGAERMREIILDLRTFSRAEETCSGPVELAPILRSCVSMAWNEIRHRARLVQDLAPVPPVRGNEARLGQVFLNLLVNAAQSMPEGGADQNEIRLATRARQDGRIVVEVQDTGCGIAPEHRARIFDPFFTTKAPGVGTGLGLSICHNLVTELGGSIEVESAPGRGSLFRVVLVQWTEPGEAPAPPSRPERALARRRGRVLVVDDEALVAASVRRALASEHDVTTVVGGREALEHLAACHEYDVVVSDLLMPEITGIELWNALRERCPELAGRMVFLTGGAFTPASGEFVEAHRDACLQKPFALGELRDLVRSRMK